MDSTSTKTLEFWWKNSPMPFEVAPYRRAVSSVNGWTTKETDGNLMKSGALKTVDGPRHAIRSTGTFSDNESPLQRLDAHCHEGRCSLVFQEELLRHNPNACSRQ